MKRTLGRAGPWLAWWVVLFWFWFLLVGEWDRYEWIAAACAATIGASLGETVRRLGGVSARVPLRWLWAAYPAYITLVVMVTANHFWLDAVAGALVAAVSAYTALALARARPESWAWKPVAEAQPAIEAEAPA